MCETATGKGRERTEIFDENLFGSRDVRLIGELSLAILQGLSGGRVEDSDAIEVTNLGLLGDQDLEIIDRGISRQIY